MACHDTQKKFEYFADWCPEELKTRQYNGLPPIHAIIDEFESFSIFLKPALRYHPNDLGLLFQMNRKGKTACERTFKKFGKDETMSATTGDLIHFDDLKVPIMHRSDLYPFMVAASGETCDLSAVFSLLIGINRRV